MNALLQLSKKNSKEISDNLKKLIDRIDEAQAQAEGSASNE